MPPKIPEALTSVSAADGYIGNSLKIDLGVNNKTVVAACENNIKFAFSGDSTPTSTLVISIQSDNVSEVWALHPGDAGGFYALLPKH